MELYSAYMLHSGRKRGLESRQHACVCALSVGQIICDILLVRNFGLSLGEANKRARFSGIFCWDCAHWAADAGSSCLVSSIWRKIYMDGTLLSVVLLFSSGTELRLACVEEMSFVASSMEA
jgi:hypothetical protein